MAATAWFECGVRSRYEEGDHLILVCRIESFEVAGGPPLIFHDSRYVTELAESPRRAGARSRAALSGLRTPGR